MTVDLDRLEALTNAATPGEWFADTNGLDEAMVWRHGIGPIVMRAEQGHHDSRFIAAARQAMPLLLEEVRQLRERRDKAIKRLTKYRADTFLSEQIIAILEGTEAQWYAKYDIKPPKETQP